MFSTRVRCSFVSPLPDAITQSHASGTSMCLRFRGAVAALKSFKLHFHRERLWLPPPGFTQSQQLFEQLQLGVLTVLISLWATLLYHRFIRSTAPTRGHAPSWGVGELGSLCSRCFSASQRFNQRRSGGGVERKHRHP